MAIVLTISAFIVIGFSLVIFLFGVNLLMGRT